MRGYLTLKCDVYRFGVVILGILSGQRNRATPTLLSDAWESWNHHKTKDFFDSAVAQPAPELLSKLQRCLQIGLPCVQQLPGYRPSISAVITMLNSSGSDIHLPKRPVLHSRTGTLLCEGADLSTEEVSGTRSFTVYHLT
ncbi:hypothetical protein PR202_ga18902 [Eleusine coracana subsp. coracana]|uniref:Uncharacterized protein n=1 Tax=Eleusine coracana subsp. coracana TaxID=191504 RepID=A0AAV5CU60_ELECO|nr:hypothetical protein PR202_ga18902 [Eleusine coracana subsp. coracana]